MTKELSEDSKFQISIKTLVGIVVAVATVISAYFGLMASINSKFADLEIKVEEALKKHGVGNTETYAPTQDSGIKTLTYGNLIFPLIKAVQELSAKVEALEKK